MKPKAWKILSRVLLVVVAIVVVCVVYIFLISGNSYRFSVKNVASTYSKPNSPLVGKTIIFLGSSVTYGSGNIRTSFVDYLAAFDKANCIKEAVPGTTLADRNDQSYVRRIQNNLNKLPKVGYFVCQLSTNDATFGSEIGELSPSDDKKDFNTKQIIGAIEFIIVYAREKWDCPVVFYTNQRYTSIAYDKMVQALY